MDTQEQLCHNHLVSWELLKLMDDDKTDKEPSWDDIPREIEPIGEICIDTGTLVISDPVFIHDASEQAFEDKPNGYTQVKFKDIDRPCAMITSFPIKQRHHSFTTHTVYLTPSHN